MKTRQLFAATALALFSFAPCTFAANPVYYKPIEIEEATASVNVSAVKKSLVLNLGSVTKETVSVTLTDQQGDIIFSENVKNNPNFRRVYNLLNLEDGDYNLIVTKTTVKTTQPFTIENEAIALSLSQQEDVNIPVFGFDKNKLSVNFLLKEHGSVKLRIFDNEGKAIMTDLTPSVLAMHKRYDTSKLLHGAYFVELIYKDESFTFSFVK